MNNKSNFTELLQEGTNKIYFGHAGDWYNTPQEKKGMLVISRQYPWYNVINPNRKGYDKRYLKLGFDLFFNIIEQCEFGIFMPPKNGHWTVGIYEEAAYFHRLRKKVYVIDPATYKITFIKDPTNIKSYETGLTKRGEIHRRAEGAENEGDEELRELIRQMIDSEMPWEKK